LIFMRVRGHNPGCAPRNPGYAADAR